MIRIFSSYKSQVQNSKHYFLSRVTGDMYEVGAECGRYYSVNVPLKEGIDDQSMLSSLFYVRDL